MFVVGIRVFGCVFEKWAPHAAVAGAKDVASSSCAAPAVNGERVAGAALLEIPRRCQLVGYCLEKRARTEAKVLKTKGNGHMYHGYAASSSGKGPLAECGRVVQALARDAELIKPESSRVKLQRQRYIGNHARGCKLGSCKSSAWRAAITGDLRLAGFGNSRSSKFC